MICYKDMTFCKEDTCKRFGGDCHRALTTDEQRKAQAWWGWRNGLPPVAVFVDKPECYEEEER